MKATLLGCFAFFASSAFAQPPPHPPPPAQAEAPFLGVETTPVSGALADQLNLSAHTGLVVVGIAPDGPSVHALMLYDVLTKLDDQILIEPYQFAVLVRSHHPGDSVTLSYLRGGKRETATVKLAAHALPKLLSVDPFRAQHLDPNHLDKLLRQMHAADATHISLTRDDGTNVTLDRDSGHSVLTLTTREGTPLFTGPIDTPEQRKALPAAAAAGLSEIEKVQLVVPHNRSPLRPFIDVPGKPPGFSPQITQGTTGTS